MNARSIGLTIAVLVAVGAAVAGGYWIGARPMVTPAAAPPHAAGETSPPAASPGERKVLYWYDPMVPQQKFDQPGKSPFMDMELMPKYADEEGSGGTVAIDPRVTQNLGVRTVPVETGTFWRRVDAVGTVQADEHRIVSVQARAAGWVETLKVRAVNDRVTRGQLLAEIYSPDILAAEEEYLLLLGTENGNGGDDALRAAARNRLVLFGVSARDIEALERDRKTNPRIGLYAPGNGIVSELGVREGGQVSPGMSAFTLLDLSSVWVHTQVPEDQIAWIAPGRPTEARLRALPDQVFEGRVDYIYPDVDEATRTVRVRSVLPNKGLKLRPGMVADVVVFGGPKREVLLVPSEALIYTGTRNVIVVAEGPGKFRAVEVKPGMEASGKTEILEGLAAGQEVVVSGQFLIDSEASLTSALTRLEGAPDGTIAAGAPEVHRSRGTIKRIDAEAAELTIEHGPFVTLGMPGMTMGFPVKDKAMLSQFQAGARVDFGIARGEDGEYRIVELRAVEN
jgi:Cu(I)/Ag(I) efflux system membrane fusion protein